MDSVASVHSRDAGLLENLFEACLDLFIAVQKLAHRSKAVSKGQVVRLHRQLERLLLWGDGCGASNGDLDAPRLHLHSAHLSMLILQLLSAIGRTLLYKLIPTLTIGTPGLLRDGRLHKAQVAITHSLEKVDYINLEDFYDSEDDNSDSLVFLENSGSAVENVVESLTTYMDSLLDATPALEQAMEYDDNEIVKPATETSVRTQLNVSEVGRPYCMKILDRFPNASVTLVERLGEANAERHKRIRGGAKQYMAFLDDALDALEEAHENEDKRDTTETVTYTSFYDSALGPSISGPSVNFRNESVPPLNSKHLVPPAISTATFNSFFTDENPTSLRVPPLPKGALEGQKFVCEICERLVGGIHNRLDWKKHVFSDLQPYVCTYTSCSDDRMYPTRRAWWAHECENHRTEESYACPDCRETFSVQAQVIDHIQKLHAYDSTSIISNGASKTLSTPYFKIQTCPLCIDSVGGTFQSLAKHIGKHLEQIALAVIPRDTEGDDASDLEELSAGSQSDEEPHEEYILAETCSPPFEGDAASLRTKAKPRDIDPTYDGFRQDIQALNPGIPPVLLDRLATEQLRRFKKLMDLKIKHANSTNTGACPSGTLCSIDKHEDLPSQYTKRHDSTHIGVSSSGIIPSDKLVDGVPEGLVTAEQFPHGIPMPPVERLPAEFECPLCFKVKQFRKASDWSKHVHEDLQPFVCTFTTCAEPKSFKRKADWVRHENERHRQLEWWKCNQSDCSHMCYRIGNFVQHLVREHKLPVVKASTAREAKWAMERQSDIQQTGKAEGEDLSWQLVKQCRHETPKNPSDEPCKFCGTRCNTWKKLAVHLAKHMDLIAAPVLEIVKHRDVESDFAKGPIEI